MEPVADQFPITPVPGNFLGMDRAPVSEPSRTDLHYLSLVTDNNN